MALEKPAKLGIFFSYFVATLTQHDSVMPTVTVPTLLSERRQR